MSKRTISKWALAFLRGEPIPLFTFKADNYAVDAEVDRLLQRRRSRIRKFRSSGVFYASGLSRGGGR